MIISQDQPRNRPGIYKIENTITRKVYIGSSVRIKRRWNDHISDLKSNSHHCRHLQNSYNIHFAEIGNDDFIVFTILELMPDASKLARLEREEWWIALFISEGIEVYNSNLKPTTQYGPDARCSIRRSGSTEYKPGNIPWISSHGHDAEARALIGEKSKIMWKNPEIAQKINQACQSDEMQARRSQLMREAWINNRDKIMSGMQTEKYKKRHAEASKLSWDKHREKLIASMNNPEVKKKVLISRFGEEKALKLLDCGWLVEFVHAMGKAAAAREIGVGYYVCDRWYKKALIKLGIENGCE